VLRAGLTERGAGDRGLSRSETLGREPRRRDIAPERGAISRRRPRERRALTGRAALVYRGARSELAPSPFAAARPRSSASMSASDPAVTPRATLDGWTVLSRVVALLAPHRWSLILVAVTIAVGAGLGIVTPLLTQAVFDRAL